MNWYHFEPADEYHARSRNGEYLSSHLLDDFRKSPLLYHKKVNGEIEPEDSTAFLFGRAVHALALEGIEAFQNEFIVSDGPVNEKTGKVYGKTSGAYQDWLATQDKDVISMSEPAAKALQDMRTFMFRQVYSNPVAKAEESRAEQLVEVLYDYFFTHEDRLPDFYLHMIVDETSKMRAVCDYISAMSDHFAIAKYEELFVPKAWSVL